MGDEIPECSMEDKIKSVKDFEDRFFPNKKDEIDESPYEAGQRLANEALSKLKWDDRSQSELEIEKLKKQLDVAKGALWFYASNESMSCRLRMKDSEIPQCLTGDSDYFQDPADLPIVKDGGEKAREALRQIEEVK